MSDILNTDYFCILPWIHMHVWPNGDTYPCCLANSDYKLGNTDKSSFQEIWNSDRMKTLRSNILEQKPTAGCSKCYEHQKNGARSMRQNMNDDFKHLYNRIQDTLPDGSVENIHMAYMDIRFSNICNMKCRTCGPNHSSFWVDDAIKIGRYDTNSPKILKIKNDTGDLWQEIIKWIDTVEKIYFAGGEPLIMEEHYRILNYLIDTGKTDISISYNTNMSKMEYKSTSVIDLWKNFKHINVGASLDAMGERAEYMRKGTNWSEIENNVKVLKRELPNIEFNISSTISAYNVLHCVDFFQDWIDKEYIKPTDIDLNILLHPSYQQVKILPLEMRSQAIDKIHKFLDHNQLQHIDRSGRTFNMFNALITALGDYIPHQAHDFIRHNSIVDEIRNERLFDTFPELKGLLQQ